MDFGFGLPEPPAAVWSGPGKLEDVAWKGRCVVVDKTGKYWSSGRQAQDYRSEVLTDPTWEDLMRCATEQIKATGDWHHVFLEGVGETKLVSDLEKLAAACDPDGPITFICLWMGS